MRFVGGPLHGEYRPLERPGRIPAPWLDVVVARDRGIETTRYVRQVSDHLEWLYVRQGMTREAAR